RGVPRRAKAGSTSACSTARSAGAVTRAAWTGTAAACVTSSARATSMPAEGLTPSPHTSWLTSSSLNPRRSAELRTWTATRTLGTIDSWFARPRATTWTPRYVLPDVTL
ncbi:unnamed protein product, partial [Laminaria digitata]